MALKLVIGLGNPGQKYDGTRHNVGFVVLDKLAAEANAGFAKHLRWRALVCKHPSALLLKPQTFMNDSGISASAALNFYKWDPAEVLVVYDDTSLPLGALKFRMSGSAGGHNGIKSLINHFGSSQFPRLKIGIGGPKPGEMVGHVLGKFKPDEREDVENTLDTAAKAVQLALSQGVEAAANIHNVKTN